MAGTSCLCAKETFEAAGFTVLHGLTDCLWVQKPGFGIPVGADLGVRPRAGAPRGAPLQKAMLSL